MRAGSVAKPRVLLITEQVDPGGKRSHVEALSAGLGAIGWRVTLFDWRDLSLPERAVVAAPNRLLDLVQPALGHRWLVPMLGHFFEMRLRALGRAAEIAIWHVQEPFTLPAARRASGGRPVALTVHGPVHREIAGGYGLPLEHPTIRWIRELERRAYLDADAVISVDRAHADYVRGFGRTERIWIVPNFVDTRRFHPGVTPESFPEAAERFISGRPVVLCPRRLVPKTGVDVAIRAVRLMAERRAACVLVVAGDGPQRRELETLVREIGAGENVLFLGVAPPARMPGWYRRADAIVVPSIRFKGVEEATSIAVLEAQASARPVVASALGGLLEIVEDGVSGLLAPPGDVEALARALEQVIEDRAFGARLGAVAAARVADVHSHVAGARSYAAVYHALGAGVRGLVD